jgi:hypothetical protein
MQRTVGLIGPLGIAAGLFVRSAAVRLPIAEPLLRRLKRYELAASIAIVLAVFGLILGVVLQLPGLAFVGLAGFVVPVAVHWWRRSHWVNVGQVSDGAVRIGGCHPEFVVEAEARDVKLLF